MRGSRYVRVEAKQEAEMLSNAAVSIDSKIVIDIVGELNEERDAVRAQLAEVERQYFELKEKKLPTSHTKRKQNCPPSPKLKLPN